jgi:hypothetical protein
MESLQIDTWAIKFPLPLNGLDHFSVAWALVGIQIEELFFLAWK